MITVILGASQDPSSYSWAAAVRLEKSGFSFVPMSNKKGELLGRKILDINDRPRIAEVHTIVVYLRAEKQKEWHEYLLSLNPKRIIFNPGAENPELFKLASEKGIMVENACTLTLLSIGAYA